jgi:serine/threonine protein kinase
VLHSGLLIPAWWTWNDWLSPFLRCTGWSSISSPEEVLVVMEFFQHDLQSIECNARETGEVLSMGDVYNYMVQLLCGLSALHQRGILHCDLKSEKASGQKHGCSQNRRLWTITASPNRCTDARALVSSGTGRRSSCSPGVLLPLQ